jgi:hypothetical protein
MLTEETRTYIANKAHEMNRAEVPWYAAHGEIARLLRWLNDTDAGIASSTCVEIVEKPWNWTEEYVLMLTLPNVKEFSL